MKNHKEGFWSKTKTIAFYSLMAWVVINSGINLTRNIIYSQESNIEYLVTVRVQQLQFEVSVEELAKNECNALILEFPVTKQYYDKAYVGQVIKKQLIPNGGWWQVTIMKKIVRIEKRKIENPQEGF